MVFTLIYVLSVVICFAVGVMLTYHLYEIAYGETGVESQDNDVYRRQAKERNEVYYYYYSIPSTTTSHIICLIFIFA